jgi:signal transduction histidine kinase
MGGAHLQRPRRARDWCRPLIGAGEIADRLTATSARARSSARWIRRAIHGPGNGLRDMDERVHGLGTTRQVRRAPRGCVQVPVRLPLPSEVDGA